MNTQELKIFRLSSLTNNSLLFQQFVCMIYAITNHLNSDYPNYRNWFYSKQIPRVCNGKGEILICTINNNLAGIASLKKDAKESKLCTLFVLDYYRKKNVSNALLKNAFKYLGTTKPLITLPDYKYQMFQSIIIKYKWELTQILDKGYYNNTSCELVFNGYII